MVDYSRVMWLVCICDAEMVESMKSVAGKDVELTVEERNLLSVAYKNVIGARRASWRIISSIEQKEESKGGEDKLNMIRVYRQTVRAHLCEIFIQSVMLLCAGLVCVSVRSGDNLKYFKILFCFS